MAAVDVLNPKRGFDDTLGFNANWNYGSKRARGANRQFQRPMWGAWNSRITSNYGYTFPLTFVDRPIEQVNYLKHFYEAFAEDGFTLVDYDDSGRHHVGCFTTVPQETHNANGKYNIEVVFEDLPGAAMLKYPDNDPHQALVVDKNLNVRVAAMQGAWTPQQQPGVPALDTPVVDGVIYYVGSSFNPATYELLNVTPAVGDWAQLSYVGWGFLWNFRLDPTFGVCDIYLDGVRIVIGLDLSTGTPVHVASTGVTVYGATGQVSVVKLPTPLNRHFLKIVATGVGAGGGYSLIFPSVEYLY